MQSLGFQSTHRRLSSHGYVILTCHGHPMANGKGEIYEHRAVMAEVLGRVLLPTEVVIHIDGNKESNTISNLLLYKEGQMNPSFIEDGIRVLLVYSKGKIHRVLLDHEDYFKLCEFHWCLSRRYVVRYPDDGQRFPILMHREILVVPEGMETDHINGNGLDNRRINLRIVSHRQNSQNLPTWSNSGVRDVYQRKSGRFTVRVGPTKKRITFGTFDTLEEACEVAKQARAGMFTHHNEDRSREVRTRYNRE